MHDPLPTKLPLALLLGAGLSLPSMAQNLTQFQNGQVADANAVNANFNAVQGAADAALASADAAQAALGVLTSALAVSPALVQLDRRLQFPPVVGNRKIVLFENADNDQQFVGFGVENGVFRYQAGNTATSHVFYAATSPTASNELMRIGGNGRVGIGTANPDVALDVNGDVMVRSGRKLYFGRVGEETDTFYFERPSFTGNQQVLRLVLGDDPTQGSGTDTFAICTSGSASGTGTIIERIRFWGDGAVFKPGGGSWGVLSDAREKHDIEPMAGSLEQLLRLRGVTFRYNEDSPAATEGVQRGFIAQEVEPVFPDWIVEKDLGAGRRKMLSISGFEALTVESLRELKQASDALRAENDELRARLLALEHAVAELQPLRAAGRGERRD